MMAGSISWTLTPWAERIITPPHSAAKRLCRAHLRSGKLRFSNNFATYLDANGVRWLYASVRGPVSSGIYLEERRCADRVRFGVQDHLREWQAIAHSGLALARYGVSRRSGHCQWAGGCALYRAACSIEEEGRSGRFCMFWMPTPGKELYVGNKATTYASSGLAVANSQIYFATQDSTLYAYGIPLER